MTHQKILRQFRDTFNPDNEFVFMKRLRFNLPDYEFAQPGDPVTPKLVELIGRAKLKVWFDGGYIASRECAIGVGIPLRDEPTKNGTIKPAPAPKPVEEKPKKDKKPVEMIHTGGGWYQVVYSDQSRTKVQGKKRAQALMEQ